jgi:hypothetical protein
MPAAGFTPTAPSALAARRDDVTGTLDAVWLSDGGGQGGRPLDDALTNLGESYIEGGRVGWDPPAELATSHTDYLSQSLAELNRLIEKGVMEIDADGNIKPTGA